MKIEMSCSIEVGHCSECNGKNQKKDGCAVMLVTLKKSKTTIRLCRVCATNIAIAVDRVNQMNNMRAQNEAEQSIAE